MDVVELLLITAATARLTRLITTDRITAPLRDLLPPDTAAGYLVRCNWCTAIWTAALTVTGWALLPDLAFTIPAATLTAAMAAAIALDFTETTPDTEPPPPPRPRGARTPGGHSA